MGEHLSDRYPKAREDYRCWLCDYPIPAGEEHVARSFVNEGKARTFRMHLKCELATRYWDDEDWEHTEPWTFRVEVLSALAPAPAGEREGK